MEKAIDGASDVRSVEEHIRSAQFALTAGSTSIAHIEALRALDLADSQDSRAHKAAALMCLAQCDRAVGRHRRARDSIREAIGLFRILRDVTSEIDAHSLLSVCCSFAGHDEEAVEAALLSLRLSELIGDQVKAALAQNYLGIAYTWSGRFAHATVAFDESVRLFSNHGSASRTLQPMLNSTFSEAIRLANERYYSGRLPSIETLVERATEFSRVMARPAGTPMLPEAQRAVQVLGSLTDALTACWSGDTAYARTILRQTEREEQADESTAWRAMAATLDAWVRTELSWLENDFDTAGRWAREHIARATAAEWEPMALVGHLMLIQILEQRDDYPQLLSEYRAMRRRTQRLRHDGLDARQRVVQIQLDVRANEESMAKLERHSEELERLSFEDSLTGLPNRRRLDLQMKSLLTDAFDPDHPLCLALIDLDKFKRINDEHSHLVGDEVLKAVSVAMRQTIRHTDLPVRLAGDEFVVLFPRTPIHVAAEISERIKQAIESVRIKVEGDAVVQVGASVGVAQAARDETAETVIRRADLAMFAKKGSSSRIELR